MKTKQNNQKNRLAVTASVVLLSTILAACETSQMLDVSNLLSPGAEKTASAPAKAQESSPKSLVRKETTKAETTGEENVVLRGPDESTSKVSGTYPSLSEQPEKPGKTLNVADKDREISELEDLSKTHVQKREDGLEGRARTPKKSDEGIFGLGWLNSSKPTVAKTGKKTALTPPEKLRLARTRALAPDAESTPDDIATNTPDLSGVNAGLRSTPIIPSVPEKEDKAPRVKVPQVETAKTTAPRDNVAKAPEVVGNRPSAQAPKMVFFSDGSRKLTQNQQKPLDEIAQFRDDSGANIYVLGFSTTDPTASNESNIESQDLAISRANHVANGLKNRGFSADQVVVQIIDELPAKGKKFGAALRRVEVYFENTQSTKATTTAAPKQVAKKSRLDFLKGKPFEYSGSEN